MSLSPKKYTNCQSCCDADIGLYGFNQTVIDNFEYSFELSPNYKQVYIIHDSSENQEFLHDESLSNNYGLQKYKSWIYAGTEEEQTVGHKYIEMYPYDSPVLKKGDYVAFDYYDKDRKSVWLCLALNSDSEYEQIGKIRMCTNEVRFYNENGELLKIPCVFDNKINSEKNTSLSNLKYINGITTIYMQLNKDSQQLKPNQRLIFGRQNAWTCFRIVSVGVDNFMNTVYFDNDSAKVLEITMEAAYVNEETDDLVNGIADANKFNINLSQDIVYGKVGESVTINASVIKNQDIIVNKSISWNSSDESVATVQNGVVTFISNGNAVITAYMEENTNVYSSCNIIVQEQEVPEYEVVFSPYADNYFGILQGDEQEFSCYLYNNGIRLENEFEFILETNIPDSYYKYSVIDGNHFIIKNIKMDYDNISVRCVSGEYVFNAIIKLKGAW